VSVSRCRPVLFDSAIIGHGIRHKKSPGEDAGGFSFATELDLTILTALLAALLATLLAATALLATLASGLLLLLAGLLLAALLAALLLPAFLVVRHGEFSSAEGFRPTTIFLRLPWFRGGQMELAGMPEQRSEPAV
jgi:hypothetical protein